MVEPLNAREYEICLVGYDTDGVAKEKLITYVTDQGIEHVLHSIKFGHVPFAVEGIGIHQK